MEGRAKERRICENEGIAGGASSTHTSIEDHEMATSSEYDYEVFLSFRGPDTRAGFTDFLYTSLKDAGIRTFKDDEELRVGEEFAPKLLQAIKQSKILIPIFSRGYASSVLCLKELVQMVECQKIGGQKIMPIFYDVAPSEVRHRTGSYGEAFLSHENKKRYDEKTMREWEAALEEVSFINGWDLHKPDRREGEFAKQLTQKVFTELKKAYLAVSDCLVNVDNHVDAIMEMIGVEASETRIIGIHGMGGIGKTTIAKIIYNRLSKSFEHCCFLSNVRETSKLKGIQCLQHQLISDILRMKWMDLRNSDEGTQTIKEKLSNKKVLLLLDDVDEKNYIRALVGNGDWIGKGSKLIITTRNRKVLKVLKVDGCYAVNGMDLDQSLQLFSKHAFRRDYPLYEYINQSKKAINIAKGLPLTLEVIGSLLSSKEKELWDDILDKLENVLDEEVQSKLKISYEALDVRQKHIFCDIACLFIGYDKNILVHFWESKFLSKDTMDILENMSLIKIEKYNKVWMHDHLRDLGREIVRQESKMKIKKQSRVWDPEEALDLLRRREGKTKVEALRLHFDHERQYRFTYKDFEKISNLRFLRVDDSKECFCAEERLQENLDLLPQLRWLSWPKIPPTFDLTKFSMKDVVILDLSESKITHHWEGWSHMKMMKDLKVLNLTNCVCLERTPDFSAHSKLERLILRKCCKLVEIDKSICQLKNLVFLDLNTCCCLQRLPDEMGRDLASLKYLDMSVCSSLEGLPNTIGNLKSLNELFIYGSMKNLPDALWTIEKLEVLETGAMGNLDMKIGNGIYRNRSLRILNLHCKRMHVVPKLPESLIILELSCCYMDTFPVLSNLTNLKELRMRIGRCHSDGESDGPMEEDPVPRWLGNLSKLESIFLWSPCVTALQTNTRSLLPQLKSPELSCCPYLHLLSSLPSSLSSLELVSGCLTTLPTDMSSLLPRLQSLKLQCPNLHCLPSLPSSLSSLDLESEYITTLATDMSSLLPQLKLLRLRCPNLRCLPSLPSSLRSLELYSCKSSCSMEELSNLKTLSDLRIEGGAISEIPILDRLENLGYLWLEELHRVKILPDLSNLNKLAHLDVYDCGNLVEIHGDLPPSLEGLEIWSCESLKNLPDLSSLKGLKRVEIKGCRKLNVKAISSLCSEKGVEFEGDNVESGCEFDYESEGEDDESGWESGWESEYGED